MDLHRLENLRQSVWRLDRRADTAGDKNRIVEAVPVLCDIAELLARCQPLPKDASIGWRLIPDKDVQRLSELLDKLAPQPPDPERDHVPVIRCPERACDWERRGAHYEHETRIAYEDHYRSAHGGRL